MIELTEFERTLADICIGWIGEEVGWEQYIKDNADVLLKQCCCLCPWKNRCLHD